MPNDDDDDDDDDAYYPRPSVLIAHSNLCCSFPLQRQSHFQYSFFLSFLSDI